MALDAPTIAGLILGVLGLFGMSMMYKFSKTIWKTLRKSGRIWPRRNEAGLLPITSITPQSRVATSPATSPIHTRMMHLSDSSYTGGITRPGWHIDFATSRERQQNDHRKTIHVILSLSVGAPENELQSITAEHHGGLRPSILQVTSTAVSSPSASSARNRHHGPTASASPVLVQDKIPVTIAPGPQSAHLPDDTKETMMTREAQIASLNKRAAERQEHLCKLQGKELEVLRPLLDQLHASSEIQRELARQCTEYSGPMSAAQEVVQVEVADFQKRIASLEQENNKSQSFLAPIRRLPAELLAEIFVIAITGYGQNRFHMIRVCQSWRVIMLGMARIWSHLTLRPSTALEYVELVMERTKQVPLEVEISPNRISHSSHGFVEEAKPYRGMALALKTMPRWRSLTLAAFPGEGDVIWATEEGESAMTFDQPLEELEVLRITGPCEMSGPFNQFLDVVTKTSTERLTHVEIANPNVIWSLSSPCHRPLFSRLRHFKVDVEEMRDPADVLPYFENLEVLEAYRLHLPAYSHEVNLPIVHTLKRINIKMVSVQWMSGRTFPALEDCTIAWPHHPETLHLRGGVDLPVCTQFTYDNYLLEPLSEFRIPKLDKMVVRNEAWNKPRGSTQLASVWGKSANARWLKPRALYLDTQCHDQYLIDALGLHPDLEELVLGLVRPDGLGKKFFNTMVARRLKGVSSSSGAGTGSAQSSGGYSGNLVAPLVPKLKVFGVRYRRWIRDEEKDEVRPLLEKIMESRKKTETPLQSVKFWPSKDVSEEAAEELVQSRM